jgi:hypothetical protein
MVASSASGNPACFTVRERLPVRTTSCEFLHHTPRRDAHIADKDVLVGDRHHTPDNATPAEACDRSSRHACHTAHIRESVEDVGSAFSARLTSLLLEKSYDNLSACLRNVGEADNEHGEK